MPSTCKDCGEQTTAQRSTKQYCSDVCRKRAWAKRKLAGERVYKGNPTMFMSDLERLLQK